ncbi:MAG: phage/plasmid replication protein, II/X family [Methylococcales bacterium]
MAFRVGSDAVWIQGSPARVCGSGDAVFGEGPAGALDIGPCLLRMSAFVSTKFDIPLSPKLTDWHVSRIDVTGNLILDDLASVREALRVLRNCEGGRYRVSQQYGDTVYWSHKSRLRAGKAYAKGPQLSNQIQEPNYTGRSYPANELEQISRLLRLELRLGAQWIRERAGCSWYELTSERMKDEWNSYFKRMIGDADMRTNDDVKERIVVSAKTKGQGLAAYRCFLYIRSEGWEKARNEHARSTWFFYLKIIRDAGLGDADIAAGNVVPLRRKILECALVDTRADIRKPAA